MPLIEWKQFVNESDLSIECEMSSIRSHLERSPVWLPPPGPNSSATTNYPLLRFSLQDTQFSWNTSTPRLTRCFESTLLVWIPPIYFLLFLPILIRSLIKSTQRFNWNPYNAIRQFISTSLVIVALADLIIVIIDRDSLDLAGLTIFNATIRFLFTVSGIFGLLRQNGPLSRARALFINLLLF